MAKVPRKNFKMFGVNADIARVAKIGSLRAGLPAFSKDPEVLQALANYLDGWSAIAIGNNSPALEDRNAIDYTFAYMIYTIFQMGIPEYNILTEYPIGALVNDGGIIYQSIQDENVGHAFSEHTWWIAYGGSMRTITATGNILATDNYVRVVTSVGDITVTLPSCADVALGKKYTIKNALAGFNVIVEGFGSEEIDGVLNFTLMSQNFSLESVTVINNGTGWDII